MHTIKTTVYEFEELSDDAKARAREWWLRDFEFDTEGTIDHAATVADLFGLDIRQTCKLRANGSHAYVPTVYWSGFRNQGDGASFDGRYQYKKDALKLVKAYAPTDKTLHSIVKRLQDEQRMYLYQLGAVVTQQGRYVHSGSMSVDVLLHDNYPDNMSASMHAAQEAVEECMRDFADWIYRNLELEYEYQTSDEYVDEALDINDYVFTEDGERTIEIA
jgi:hypothetical protein